MKSYRVNINGIECTFVPVALYIGNDLYPLKPQVHKTKGYLFWNIGGKQVSYHTIKDILKNHKPNIE